MWTTYIHRQADRQTRIHSDRHHKKQTNILNPDEPPTFTNKNQAAGGAKVAAAERRMCDSSLHNSA